jgi:hypothetical protein
LAASNNSAGKPSKNPFNRKIGQAHADHGSTTPHTVFIKFQPVNGNRLSVKYVGINNACSGIIMVPRKNRRINLPPLGRILDNENAANVLIVHCIRIVSMATKKVFKK